MSNNKKNLRLIIAIASIINIELCYGAGKPITLVIPQAYANNIESRNYIVPDIKAFNVVGDVQAQPTQNSDIGKMPNISKPPIIDNASNNNTSAASNTNYSPLNTAMPKMHSYKKGAKNLASPYLASENISLTSKEQEALKLSKQYYNGEAVAKVGKNGAVVFAYGDKQPTIICAILRVCILELKEDEKVEYKNSGDPTSWEFIDQQTNIPTIAIKPKAAGVSTNFVIKTNKRLYTLTVKASSNPNDYMQLIKFSYDEEDKENKTQLSKTLAILKDKLAIAKEKDKPDYITDTKAFDYNYGISGTAKFKPLTIYTDGIKTYILFDVKIKHKELPIFEELTMDGKPKASNIRFLGNQYIIDSKVEKARLKAGNGKSGEILDINYVLPSKPFNNVDDNKIAN
jgi:type IV secretion system protein TrbG